MKTVLDEYLLELILMDTIAVTGKRCIPNVEHIIQRFIPEGLYDQIIARYDELSDDREDNNPFFLRRWLRIAASKDSRWKRKMIKRLLCVIRAGGPIGATELAEVASLAAAMGADQECRQVFTIAFNTGAHAWLRAS
jgi:hypothetical protein